MRPIKAHERAYFTLKTADHDLFRGSLGLSLVERIFTEWEFGGSWICRQPTLSTSMTR